MTLSYLLAAEKIIKESQTGKVSFIDVFTFVEKTKDLDFVVLSFFVGGRISDAPAGKLEVILRILDPEGKDFAKAELGGDVGAGEVDVMAQFDLLKFEKNGKYLFKISVNGLELEDGGRHYIYVR